MADMYEEQKDARREADCFDDLVARKRDQVWLVAKERTRKDEGN